MQANRRTGQSTFSGMCPLCKTPLNITDSLSSQHSIVQCPSCGYSGPYIRRQRNLPPAADQQLPPSQGNSSVWIDPAVSAFLIDGQAGQVAYTQSNLQHRSQHHHAIDDFHGTQVSGHDIDKLTTNPPKRKWNQVDIDEIDTLPRGGESMHSLVPVNLTPPLALAPVSPALPSTTIDQGGLA